MIAARFGEEERLQALVPELIRHLAAEHGSGDIKEYHRLLNFITGAAISLQADAQGKLDAEQTARAFEQWYLENLRKNGHRNRPASVIRDL